MDDNTVSKHTVSFGLSLVASSVLNALLVIAKEKSPAIQAAMQKITGHHWITHSAIVIIFFIFLGWLFAQAQGGRGFKMPVDRLIKIIITGILAAGGLIIGFYLMAD